ncbi:hypothetical protein [Conexibacter arvalis]|uniref:Uncharacterized protein n=1 Tax=Conexibacter arvalis TaxID=912552 RepID=A0A840I9D4_9ACTN|nr:hypothetical protein [Conexibacter arvalis]MBB4660744.1 hypothetical protein [Conexibacter arvalis]
MPPAPQRNRPGRAIVHLDAGRPGVALPLGSDVVEVLRTKAAALEALAATVERMRADGWRTEGAVGLAFSLGIDGVSFERDLSDFSRLERVAHALPTGTVVHWHRHDRTWRTGGWIAGLPADQQLGEADDLPVIVQSARSGRQTRCESQQQLVEAVLLHLGEVADDLDLDRAQAARAAEVRAQIDALRAGEPPQVYYRFEGSPEAEDALTSAHVVNVQPEGLARWEGFLDGVTGEPLYEGDSRLEGLSGLAFRDGFRLGAERAHLLAPRGRG